MVITLKITLKSKLNRNILDIIVGNRLLQHMSHVTYLVGTHQIQEDNSILINNTIQLIVWL